MVEKFAYHLVNSYPYPRIKAGHMSHLTPSYWWEKFSRIYLIVTIKMLWRIQYGFQVITNMGCRPFNYWCARHGALLSGAEMIVS
jgi:hypothetical protein